MKQPLLIPYLYRGRDLYQVYERYGYGTQEAPEGLIVDGASVPRPVWWFMPPDGLHRPAALIHDVNTKRKGLQLDGTRITRHQANELFLAMMIEAGVEKWRAEIAYRGVEVGGATSWNDPRNIPIVLPVRNEAPTIRRKPGKTPFTRHIYAETP